MWVRWISKKATSNLKKILQWESWKQKMMEVVTNLWKINYKKVISKWSWWTKKATIFEIFLITTNTNFNKKIRKFLFLGKGSPIFARIMNNYYHKSVWKREFQPTNLIGKLVGCNFNLMKVKIKHHHKVEYGQWRQSLKVASSQRLRAITKR